MSTTTLPVRSGRSRSNNYQCPNCACNWRPRTLEVRHGLHAALTILTGGLWGISWVALVISQRHWPFQCRRCGAHVSADLAARFRRRDEPDPEQELVEELASAGLATEQVAEPEFELEAFELERSNSSAA